MKRYTTEKLGHNLDPKTKFKKMQIKRREKENSVSVGISCVVFHWSAA